MAEKSWGDILRDHAPDLDEQNRADLDFLGHSSALSARVARLSLIAFMRAIAAS